MPGLSASELSPQTLYPGDTIDQHSGGDPARHDDEEVADRFGEPLPPDAAKWRKLRTYKLISGSFASPTRASALKKLLEGVVEASMAAVREALGKVPEEIVPESPQSDCASPLQPDLEPEEPPSARVFDLTWLPSQESEIYTTPANDTNEGTTKKSFINEIINLVSSQEEDATTTGPVVSSAPDASDAMVAAAATYMKSIPSGHDRGKIRNQPKKRRVECLVPRSRKRKDLAKSAITRSGLLIYHAKTVKAAQLKSVLRSPEVKLRLRNLHARRPSFPEYPVQQTTLLIEEVSRPDHIQRIETCAASGVTFRDIGAFDPCECAGDCFLDSCKNVASATFCTPSCCQLGERCSNAPHTLNTLKLFDTGRVGLGVYTTTNLDVGDVLGEYCGELIEFPAIVEGQPDQAVKQNSGFTLLYNTKSSKRNYVYVDALKSGSVTRFICHACDPNVTFVEQQNRSSVKVIVKMVKDVKAGAQITVNYGKERWFTCACDDCCQVKDEEFNGEQEAQASAK
ncbi:hypothetical protein PF004_g21883 [Phytophthora fragariae]|uniref:SET domain-containing protein n=1 Tax=Phytophthora fragariae TaxID=53985 RepID=A0A6A3IM12_9STRA|nr:hypothetical protein PF011_g21499 [Phytophthora fragariae]KAE9190504.1 hypothetical protein PF004_g21883 [Phytophthora fragariae]